MRLLKLYAGAGARVIYSVSFKKKTEYRRQNTEEIKHKNWN